MKLDFISNQWKLSMYNNPYTYAIFNETYTAFGTQHWYVFNDTCEEENNNGFQLKKLSFSGCHNDKFNCLDGTW